MTNKIISGGRTARDIARSYLERIANAQNDSADSSSTPPATSAQQDVITLAPTLISASLQNDVYVFDIQQVLQVTTPDYRQFLKESGYADLDSCSKLAVGKDILKWSPEVRDLAGRLRLKYNKQPLTGNNGEYVVNINQIDGRRLVNGLIPDSRLLTTQLMYGLFIPYIKQEAQNGNSDAQATLDEMIQTKAEWLEDLVLGKSRIKIGTKENPVTFVTDKDGRFDRADLNEFGYPKSVKDKGEFQYWYPRGDERAVIRNWDSDLILVCSRGPSYVDDGLGLRVAKFF